MVGSVLKATVKRRITEPAIQREIYNRTGPINETLHNRRMLEVENCLPVIMVQKCADWWATYDGLHVSMFTPRRPHRLSVIGWFVNTFEFTLTTSTLYLFCVNFSHHMIEMNFDQTDLTFTSDGHFKTYLDSMTNLNLLVVSLKLKRCTTLTRTRNHKRCVDCFIFNTDC